MSQYVTDTMAIVLYLSKRKMPLAIKQLFQSADLGLTSIIIPAFVAVEISFLFAKGRIDVSLVDLQQHINKYPTYTFEPLTLSIIEASLPMTDIPELHDRLIAATARQYDLPVITNDPDITASAFVEVIW
ncbi:type II toxin-antitoxin system VapC family toxin [Spirosoma linguale]|uniref:PIN domain-containing protein n=1 Tax=Spirosoma linguale (strain ATCC 33905 / DSM 74 / LMG 10896 / Claus 1) TaxID=504472 RepID=D2QPK3_SPILD|nr:conserved hypothetical protein [Spirosoma linguale DSM 74]